VCQLDAACVLLGGGRGVQEEEARQIALLEEAMRASPSLVSAFSDQLRDNISVRSFRGTGYEPRRCFTTVDRHSHLVSLPTVDLPTFFLLLLRRVKLCKVYHRLVRNDEE